MNGKSINGQEISVSWSFVKGKNKTHSIDTLDFVLVVFFCVLRHLFFLLFLGPIKEKKDKKSYRENR